MTSQISGRKPLILFYSYSHRDERYRDALAIHLATLKRQGVIKEWYDREIGAGEEWRNVIDDRLGASDIILLLVSPDFIASDYCWGTEIARAMARYDAGETHVIPIIVRPVDWNGAPFGSLQALPKNGKAITLWANRDVAWLDVERGIGKVVEALVSGLQIKRAPSGPSILPSSKATPIQTLER